MDATTLLRTRTRRLLAGAAAGFVAGTSLLGGLVDPAAATPGGVAPGTIGVAGGVLTVDLPDRENVIGVSPTRYGVVVVLHSNSPMATGAGCTRVGFVTATEYRCSDVTAVDVVGGSDSDLVWLAGLRIPTTIDGGAGDDQLIGGHGPATVYGGDGDDFVGGTATSYAHCYPWVDDAAGAVLDGGPGDDWLFGGG